MGNSLSGREGAMSDAEWERVIDQQQAILSAISEVKGQIEAGEQRRKCLWLLGHINRAAERLKERMPRTEKTFAEILEAIDFHANTTFKTSEDLHTVFSCFGLVAGVLEEAGKAESPSSTEIWKQIYELLDDLGTLESGDPARISGAEKLIRDLRPELQEAERITVRERFKQRSRASIDKMFERREAEAEKYY
jgi:hypothetical protein